MLRGLRGHGFHGVYDAERATGQTFVVDVELVLDLGPAAASDDVTDTVHYGELAQRVVAVVEGEPVAPAGDAGPAGRGRSAWPTRGSAETR